MVVGGPLKKYSVYMYLFMNIYLDISKALSMFYCRSFGILQFWYFV